MLQQRISVQSSTKNGATKPFIAALVGIVIGITILRLLPLYALLDRPWGFKEAIWYFIGDTVFSKEFSEIRFHMVRPGMSPNDVGELLGEPIRRYRNVADVWTYEDNDGSNVELYFHYQGLKDQVCYSVQDSNTIQLDSLMSCHGKRQSQILMKLGWPKRRIENRWTEETWAYTYSPGDTHFIRRYVTFDRQGRVISKTADCYFD